MASTVPPSPSPSQPSIERTPTRLESMDDIRVAAQQARESDGTDGGAVSTTPPPLPSLAAITKTSPMLPPMPDLPPAATPLAAPIAAAPPTPAPRRPSVRHFRPSLRPPVPHLCVFDDGADDGEVIRIRGERFVIGRAEGDLVLPHDEQISGRHAELVREKNESGRWGWVLTDLGSTNGTFVRVGVAILKDGQEFLIGRTRYRFDAAAVPQSLPGQSSSSRATVTWNSSAGLPVPSIVELLPDGPGTRLPLVKSEHWIGVDPACDIVPTDDPFVIHKHARISCDAKGRWHVNSNKSANGVWLRIEQTDLTASCYFQLGEQRFSFKVS